MGLSVSGVIYGRLLRTGKFRTMMASAHALVLIGNIGELITWPANFPAWTLVIFEFIAGLGVSGIGLTSFVYLISITPISLKDRYISLFSFCVTLGSVVSNSIMLVVYNKPLSQAVASITQSNPEYSSSITTALSNSSLLHPSPSSTNTFLPAYISDSILNSFSRSFFYVALFNLLFGLCGFFMVYFVRTPPRN
ncbi:hypothetical protein AX774_g3797 [Zancudomyces culisetae]|nr:hypothetical protein AX774_g3797 [Zancudomyces culisetae]|eukprot:OMH82715.1 hypothetical protein AX774_g3797 [Zancudomyces culisetae]